MAIIKEFQDNPEENNSRRRLVNQSLSDTQESIIYLLSTASRNIKIISTSLNIHNYEYDLIRSLLIDKIKAYRDFKVQIVVKEVRPVVESAHPLLQLSKDLGALEMKQLNPRDTSNSLKNL